MSDLCILIFDENNNVIYDFIKDMRPESSDLKYHLYLINKDHSGLKPLCSTFKEKEMKSIIQWLTSELDLKFTVYNPE